MSVTVTQELTQQTVTVTGNPVENNATVTVSNARGPAGPTGEGGTSTFAELTDKGTADLPVINTPLSSALSGKAATSHTHTASQISDSTATGRSLLTAATQSDARTTALGSGATGDALFTAANSGAARTTLGLATADSPTFAGITISGAVSMSSFTGPSGLVEMKSNTIWQNVRLYSTTDNASNFEYITITQSGTSWRIGNNKSGTGATRAVALVAQGSVQLGANGGDGWTVSTTKHLFPDGTSNTRDLGQGGSRIRNLYVGTLIDCAGNIIASGTVQTGGYTFATLPNPATIGMRTYITNGAASPVYMANAAGGGSTVTPVFYNGSAWINS